MFTKYQKVFIFHYIACPMFLISPSLIHLKCMDLLNPSLHNKCLLLEERHKKDLTCLLFFFFFLSLPIPKLLFTLLSIFLIFSSFCGLFLLFLLIFLSSAHYSLYGCLGTLVFLASYWNHWPAFGFNRLNIQTDNSQKICKNRTLTHNLPQPVQKAKPHFL